MVLTRFTSLGMRRSTRHVTNERALLERARAYDPAALGELYDRYAPKMYAYIYRRVGDAATAEDLTSELFLRVLHAIQDERAWRDSFVAWLYRIAHNLVVDAYRRRPPPLVPLEDLPLASDEDDLADAVQDAADRDRLRAAIALLTPDQRQVLTLRFGEGLTAKETARIVAKTTGAVEAMQHRALASLRRILAKEKPL
jgi:RNA polymerase sigma-70 factor (ECF subfamily)